MNKKTPWKHAMRWTTVCFGVLGKRTKSQKLRALAGMEGYVENIGQEVHCAVHVKGSVHQGDLRCPQNGSKCAASTQKKHTLNPMKVDDKHHVHWCAGNPTACSGRGGGLSNRTAVTDREEESQGDPQHHRTSEQCNCTECSASFKCTARTSGRLHARACDCKVQMCAILCLCTCRPISVCVFGGSGEGQENYRTCESARWKWEHSRRIRGKPPDPILIKPLFRNGPWSFNRVSGTSTPTSLILPLPRCAVLLLPQASRLPIPGAPKLPVLWRPGLPIPWSSELTVLWRPSLPLSR
jgi:hypothetical protein